MNDEPIQIRCLKCQAWIEFARIDGGSVQSCPQCGEYVDVPRSIESATQVRPAENQTAQLDHTATDEVRIDGNSVQHEWIAIAAVASLLVLPSVLDSIAFHVGWTKLPIPFAYAEWNRIVIGIAYTLTVLTIVALSRVPFCEIGIVRPNWISTPIIGGSLWSISVFVGWFASMDFPAWYFPSAGDAYVFATPTTVSDYFLLAASSLVNGFMGELVFRGYLLTRLRRRLDSTSIAILITSSLYAMIHIHLGAGEIIMAFLCGALFSGAFLMTRSLWPIAFAQAIQNFYSIAFP